MKHSLADFPEIEVNEYSYRDFVWNVVEWHIGFEASLRSRIKELEGYLDSDIFDGDNCLRRIKIKECNTLKKVLGEE